MKYFFQKKNLHFGKINFVRSILTKINKIVSRVLITISIVASLSFSFSSSCQYTEDYLPVCDDQTDTFRYILQIAFISSSHINLSSFFNAGYL